MRDESPGVGLVGVLNPIKSEFRRIGVCGEWGIAEVRKVIYRLNMIITD